jgi:hypothetical protein
MKRIAMRTPCEAKPARRSRGGIAVVAAVITVSVIATGIIASSFGGSAAANESDTATIAEQPISLAGRWSGPHYGYGRQGSSEHCAAGCALTYDIVACKDGWCGIAVNADKTCGRIGVRLAADTKSEGGIEFNGKLELAKGSAPYTVKAWYRSKDGSASLHVLGDTGSELLLMRRSFPFQADLARTGDATCTLDKATS